MESLPTAAEAADDALLLEIHALAHRLAGRHATRRVTAADIAQDVVTHCLMRMRQGRWNLHGRTLDDHISCLVRRRGFDLVLRTRARGERDLKHSRELEKAPRAWMDPNLEIEERDLAAMEEATLARLTPACRRTFELVRETGASYVSAAEQLGITTHTVGKHMARALAEFRRAFRARGIEVPLEKHAVEAPRPAPAAHSKSGMTMDPNEPGELSATDAEQRASDPDYQDYLRMKGAIAYLRQELAKREREESGQDAPERLAGATNINNGMRAVFDEERRRLAQAAAYFRKELARRAEEEQSGVGETAEQLVLG